MKAIIVLPTYNERENIKWIIPEIFKSVPDTGIMVVDDNSPDGTADEVRELIKSHKNLFILERQKKTGLGDAYKDAFRKIIAEKTAPAVIMMDADGSHDPGYLQIFQEKIKNCDLVIGSRYIKGGGSENWGLSRRVLSKFGNIYSQTLTGLKISDLTSGFNCIKLEFLEKAGLDSIAASGYSFQIELKDELVAGLGAKVIEIPIIFKNRKKGKSKLSFKIIIEGFMTPLRIFFKHHKNEK